jgi:hypothetical protein
MADYGQRGRMVHGQQEEEEITVSCKDLFEKRFKPNSN